MDDLRSRALSRVQVDIDRGDLGKARDRLHGLVAQYPNDLSLRARLAEVYANLKYPRMAGRYWYLESDKTPRILEACRAFEESCGHDALHILLAIKYRGDPPALPDENRAILEGLQKRSEAQHGYFPDMRAKGRERWKPGRKATRADRVLALLFAAFLIGLVVLAAIGLLTILSGALRLR